MAFSFVLKNKTVSITRVALLTTYERGHHVINSEASPWHSDKKSRSIICAAVVLRTSRT